MLRVVLVRPGETDLDEQGRIKGDLDIPLNAAGRRQMFDLCTSLSHLGIECIYFSPCESARESATCLGKELGLAIKEIPNFRNVNHGLWQGKLIDEVRQQQRKVYRLWQEEPESICPPEGEMISSARVRLQRALNRILKKHRSGVIGIVVPEPLASLVRCELNHCELGDLWKAETTYGSWELVDVEGALVRG